MIRLSGDADGGPKGRGFARADKNACTNMEANHMSRLSQIDRRRFLMGTTALGAVVALHPFSAFAAAGQAHLRIMETTDIHVNLLPYDYYADKPNDTMGLSRTASIIESIRVGGDQLDADRQRRPSAGQPDGRLRRL